ncbi:hypothetical protein TRM7557_03074 [Tritonibacter multivorans]|uniref:DUF2793 domain-containing protein n=1 Tax=Tritonibacter multivorans TaxID=928856 RepID=A0A0P1GGN0_9RHOB|nr:DUF2793 domain-containing protein [Tritonibacter multivorans]MDA7422722.1 DUF2793 domain-containing protein [Tritonibacter multivorans]CUH80788.1 hypothetical protein TRM7557_03074 [Tritonibacter multivorans]SFD55438.1 Protein of unknown function [Tritonibacter multivorans]
MPASSANRSSRLNLPYLLPAQAQKHVTHNEALLRLDQLCQLVLAQVDALDPPVAPANGAAYGLAANPTGAWAGQGGQLAFFEGDAWHFLTPQPGWRAWVRDLDQMQVWDGAAWQLAESAERARLGVGTSADAQNPLAVAGPATLFTHAGTGHQLKLNKATAADTASLLFQSGFTGHAEIGLAGDLGLSVKTSPDGNSWSEVLKVDPATATLGGVAVQAAADDVTPGRLMRADYGYGPGNLLGAVSRAAGQPTGAVMERGEDANGAYLRLADGSQMVWGARASGTVWSFPRAFIAPPQVMVTATQGGRLVWADGVSASAATPRSETPAGAEQTGDPLQCFAVGRWD